MPQTKHFLLLIQDLRKIIEPHLSSDCRRGSKPRLQRKCVSPIIILLIGSLAYFGCSQDTAEFRWQQIDSGTDVHLYGVHFVDAERGWAVGTEGTVLTTSDRGTTWNPSSVKAISKNILTHVNFTTPNNGWIISKGGVFYTGSGGKSWNAQRVNSSAGLLDIHFVNATAGWAVGGRGTILHTQNGGNRWEKQKSYSAQHLWSVHFVDSEHGWIVGEAGEVLHTRTGGQKWIRQESGVEQPLFAVHFANLRHGWIVGTNGLILHTADGGQTWHRQENPMKQHLRDVMFQDEKRGWAVGEEGVILHTTDSGMTWERYSSPTTHNLLDIYLFKNSGWIVGEKGLILQGH